MGEGIKRAIAAAKATRSKAPTSALLALFDVAALDINEAQREAARDAILRAASAAMAQSKAEAAYDKATASHAPDGAAQKRAMLAGRKAEDAQRETCAAGAALAKALRGVKVTT